MRVKTDMSREAVTQQALANAKVTAKDDVNKNCGLNIQAAIRDILLREWNPPVSSRDVSVDRSYDRHIAPILRILVGSRFKGDLVECLQRITRTESGAETRDVERLHQMAKSLLELDVTLN